MVKVKVTGVKRGKKVLESIERDCDRGQGTGLIL
jgi:hypothetical protein